MAAPARIRAATAATHQRPDENLLPEQTVGIWDDLGCRLAAPGAASVPMLADLIRQAVPP